MSEAHREDGFVFQVYAPPREHGPPHVHVHKGGAQVVLHLGDASTPIFPLRVSGMTVRDVVKAVRIAEANKPHLLGEWEKHHDR